MRKIKIVMTLLIVMGLATGLLARVPEGYVPTPLAKTSVTQVSRTMSNISNWGYWMYASGKTAQEPDGDSGGIYPRGTTGTIYLDGLVWGGKYNGQDDQIRVGGCTYNIGTQAGWIEDDGTAASASDERVKIWRIRPDYATLTYAQVKQEAMELNQLSSLAEVTDNMCQEVIDQYEEDWENWPTDLGAPYYDNNGNGEYDDGDEPGVADADQVVWYVANDLDRTSAISLYGSEPIGIELQVTAWAYAQPGAALGQIIFKKYKFINKSGVDVTEMYVSQWCDPDIGYYGDDLVGCDTTLSMGFAYNGYATDSYYDDYDLAPVAVGYDFFQGPLVEGVAGEDQNKNGVDDAEDYAVYNLEQVGPGYINLPMASFGWFGGTVDDPTLSDYEGTLQWYNLMRGYYPNDNIDDPTPWTLGNIDGNPATKYPMAGDPVTGTGFYDGSGSYGDPADRRMCLTAGPFNFPADAEQEVVVAVIGGLGDNNLSSITDMKLTDKTAQILYDKLFAGIPKAPSSPNADVVPFEDQIVINWGEDKDAIEATEFEEIAGYSFEGYNVYQLPSSSSSIDDATKIATFDLDNGVTTIYGNEFLSEYGEEVEVPVQTGNDTGIERYFVVDKDYITGLPLYEGKTYYFGVTAYNYNENPELIEAQALESSLIVQAVVVQEAIPGTQANADVLSDFDVTHTTGSAGGSASGVVIDPYSTTGHDYEIYFDQQVYYRDAESVWQESIEGQSKLAKSTDVTGCDVTGSAIYSETVGEVDILLTMTYYSSTGAWVDGVEFELPEGMTALSATITDGSFSNYTSYGQADLSSEGIIEGNKVSWGDSLRTGIGAIEGNMYFKIVLDASEISLPLEIDYSIWDDAYAEPVVDDTGILSLTEIGYEFTTINHWNVKDVTTSETVLEDQIVIGGTTVDHIEDGRYVEGGGAGNAYTVDGIQIAMDVLYDAPTDFTGINQVWADGGETYRSISTMGIIYSYYTHDYPYCVLSYGVHGWSIGDGTARSYDAYTDENGDAGYGTTITDYLQRDYELRFTGEYDDPVESNGQLYYPIKEGTGSKAILYGSRNGDLANHPDSNNPGDGSAFFVNIPFEVWDMEDDGGPRQVTILIYDRIQAYEEGDTTYAFNPNNRMYCEFCLEDYSTVIAGDANDYLYSDLLTWNTVWWNCEWTTGDVLEFYYDNPIQFGTDTWTFTSVAPTTDDDDLAKEAVKKINVFPNPYYANNDLGTTRFDDYVTFTHLPEKATVRIFNIAGIQVRVLKKEDTSQFLKWDLQNEAGLPVGSGMYIAYIDLPDLNKTKVLKMAIIQKEQILEYY